MIDYIAYVALAAWSSLMTWFITRRRIKQEQLATDRIDSERGSINKQNSVIQDLYAQNMRLNELYGEFQADIQKLHREILELREENTSLRYEIYELNNTIKILVKVNQAETSFNIGEHQ
jgi:peptidoglycan hydrolase CwlO-like protein